MQPCLSQATTLPCSFADDVANYADAGWTAMEVWLTKLETHLDTHSIAQTQKLLSDRGITLPAASYQGGLLLSQGEQRKVHFDHFKRRLELCQAFGIKTLVLVADFAETPDMTSLQRAVVSLTQAGQWAAGFDTRVALEFRSKNAFCSSLDTALALVQQTEEASVGICLDLFHYYTGPSKFEDLGLLDPSRLFHVQLCDLAGVPRELATDADRILPGDGDLRITPILDALRQIGYDGSVSLELMNPVLWRTKPVQVAEIALTALRKILGLADEKPKPPTS